MYLRYRILNSVYSYSYCGMDCREVQQTSKGYQLLRIIQTVFKFVLKVTGAKITIIGHENVPTNQAVLYIGNHRSF